MTLRGWGSEWLDSMPLSPDDPKFAWMKDFASDLVEQLRPWIPSGIRMYVEDERTQFVRVTDEAGVWFRFHIPEMLTNDWRPHRQPRMERVEITLSAFLNQLQEYLVLHTRRPWPGSSETVLPELHIELLGSIAQAWFEPVQGEGPVLYFDIPPA